jgi:hypothetical protein
VTDNFPNMVPRVQRYEKFKFQCLITSLLFVLEQKVVLLGYRKSYPRNPEMYTYLTFDLFKGQTKVTILILDLKCLLLSICSDYEAHFLHV